MIRDKDLFTDLTFSSIEVKTGNPEGHGTAKTLVNGQEIILKNCLLVPTISQQLLSLVQILQGSLSINC
jgi:hypothetical protein